MRVAYLANYPRVSHTFIRREIHALEGMGVEVLRFSLRPVEGELPSEIDRQEALRTRIVLAEGLSRHALAVAAEAVRSPRAFVRAVGLALRLGVESGRALPRHVAYFAEACVLVRWLRAAGANHLHAHFGTNTATIAAICHELGGPPFSMTIHGPEEFDRPAQLGLGEKIRRSAFTVAISDFGRAQLSRWARYADWRKLKVVRCGLDPDLLRAPRTPVPSAPRLVCIGRLSEQKGHLLLVEAAGRLARDGVPFELVLLGDGPMRAEIEQLVRAHGLDGRVRILGWASAEQVRDEITGARALVLASFAEGLPVVIMEAFALHRPVISTAIAGIPELVEPGVSGWLVPAGSVPALAAAMREALEASPARLQELGDAGARRVAEQHDVRTEAAKLAALFADPAAAGGLGEAPAEGDAAARPRLTSSA